LRDNNAFEIMRSMHSTDLITTLRDRGFIDQISSEELKDFLKQPRRVYVGFDPTAASLHIGNLVGICALRWFQIYGHTPVVVLGGATAKIGDPSGKSIERPLLSKDEIADNVRKLKKTFTPILKTSPRHPEAEYFDNDSWLGRFTLLDFLRDVGKFFRLGPMLSKESVKVRLESPEGISLTEFSYQALQGYDFFHLFSKEDVTLQMGGSDQWGNITAGIELTRKITGETVFGLTYPLLTKSDGKKFGKSESGAIWLSEAELSPYKFYQYLLRTDDRDIGKLLRMLTFLPIEEIQSIEAKIPHDPQKAQKRLAEEVTRLVHGDEALVSAQKATEAALPGKQIDICGDQLKALIDQIPTHRLLLSQLVDHKLIDVLVDTGLAESKGAVRRLIQNGGLYLNSEKIVDPNFTISEELLKEACLLVALGKKNKALIVAV
jgi:tyrosyl-tRNA synthetase